MSELGEGVSQMADLRMSFSLCRQCQQYSRGSLLSPFSILHFIFRCWWWRSGVVNDVIGCIKGVNQNLAQLVLGWVTISVCNQPPRAKEVLSCEPYGSERLSLSCLFLLLAHYVEKRSIWDQCKIEDRSTDRPTTDLCSWNSLPGRNWNGHISTMVLDRRMVTLLMTLRDPKRSKSWPRYLWGATSP